MEKEFWVEGIHCSACVHSIEQLLKQNPNVQRVQTHLAEKKVYVQLSQNVSIQELNELVTQGGYKLIEIQEKNPHTQPKINLYLLVGLSIPLMILGMFLMDKLWAEWIMAFLASILIYQGRIFYIHAYKQALIRKASMDTLVALSTGIAYVYSIIILIIKTFGLSTHFHHHTHFEAAGMIIAFVLIGKYLEEKAQKNTQQSLKKILSYKNKKVSKKLPDGSLVEVFVKEIQKNDCILIKAGEQIPVDGIIVEGETWIDESMMTGESLPVEKKINSKVFAGTLNQFQNIVVQAEKTGENTFLEQILKAVEKAQSTKPEIQKLTDKIAGQFALYIIGIGILTLFIWWYYKNWEMAFISMISVLVVACPCALGLATPMAVIVGIGRAAKKGLLIQNANAIQMANQIQVIAFDKTGTLTEGKPKVEQILWKEGYEKKLHLEWLWFKLAQQSNHPLAQSIYQYFYTSLQSAPQLFLQFQEVQTISGKGIKGSWEDSVFFMGSEKFILENHISIPDYLKNSLSTIDYQGKSFVYFARNQECLGVAILSDQLRPDSIESVRILLEKGYELWILSGDKKETVAYYAEKLGIKNYEGELLPIQKAKKIAKLQFDGKKVMMVGDGINDSVALSKASVSIAFASGNELASNVAEVILIKNELNSLLNFLEISKQTQNLIYQNLFWAFIYNILMIPLAAGLFYPILGWQFHPMWASAAMSLSSISVVLNSLRYK